MSAIGAFVTPSGTHLFTDGACLDADGRLVGLSNKVFVLPRWNAAFALSGAAWMGGLLSNALADVDAADFDDLAADHFGMTLRKALAFAASSGHPSHMLTTVIALAGWSESRDKPALFTVTTFDRFEAKAFEPVPATRFLNPAGFCDLQSFEPQRPTETGLAMMRSIRCTKFDALSTPDRRNIFGVGGWCQHTVVARDNISTRVIERWPDRIGQQINPK